MDNSTSYFTQHLVDGLLGAADDHDGDGYVTFSDVYAYVDRRLRATGKQIPQRRVQGDGDLFLAKRPAPVPAPVQEQVTASFGVPAAAEEAGAGAGAAAGGGRVRGWSRPGLLLAGIAVAAAVAGGTTAGVLLSNGGGGNAGTGDGASAGSYTSPFTVAFNSPWRLKISDTGYSGAGPPDGCSLWLIDAQSGKVLKHLADGLYGTSFFQIKYTGTFRWRVNDQRCQVASLAGMDSRTLPFDYTQDERGDTPVFAVSTANITVRVTAWNGNTSCDFWLYDPANDQLLDYQTARTTPGGNPITLQTIGHKQAYLEWTDCATAHISPGP